MGRSRWAGSGGPPEGAGQQEHTSHQRTEKRVVGESHRPSGLTVRLWVGDGDELRVWRPVWPWK